MSRIPEVISLDAQAEKLTLTFGGNTDFDDVRGKCGDTFLAASDAAMLTKEGNAQAPSAGVKDLKKFLTSFANVRGKIAQLERDGYALAAHEAREALKYPDYRMLGEIEPLSNAVPITLMMVNPELTLSVLTQKHGYQMHWCNIEDAPTGLNIPSYMVCRGTVHYVDIIKSLRDRNSTLFEKLNDQPAKHIHHRHMSSSVLLPNKPLDQETKIGFGAFACACYASKSKLLQRFTKAEQEHIALWQFDLPKEYAGKEAHYLYFGLHKREEHEYWSRMRAPFCSLNVVNGYGAIAYPGEAYHCFDKTHQRFKGTRILLTSS